MNKLDEIEKEQSILKEEEMYLKGAKRICKKYGNGVDKINETLGIIQTNISGNNRKIRTIRKNCKHESTSKHYHNKIVCNECGEEW